MQQIRIINELAYNKLNRARQTIWKVGDRVLLSDRTVKAGSNKILTKKPYIGPYYIAEIVCGEGYGATYWLIDEKMGRTYRHLVNHDRLKRYFDNTVEMEGRLSRPPKRVQLRPVDKQIADETADRGMNEQIEETDISGHVDDQTIMPVFSTMCVDAAMLA